MQGKKKDDPETVEPGKKSTGKKIRIFTSFQEQEDEMIAYWASISPSQRLAHLYEMIKISFRLTEEDLVKRHRSSTIKITHR